MGKLLRLPTESREVVTLPQVADSALAVNLTVSQLKQLIRDELRALSPYGSDSLLTPNELAHRLKVPVSWVYEQSRQGRLPTLRVGRYIRFRLSEVLEQQRQGQLS